MLENNELEFAEGTRRTREAEREDAAPSALDLKAAATSPLQMSPASFGAVQRYAGNSGMAASVQRSMVQEVISRPGGSVPSDVASQMTAGGLAPANVQVHSDDLALESAKSVGAYAYQTWDDQGQAHAVVPKDAPLAIWAEETAVHPRQAPPTEGFTADSGEFIGGESNPNELQAKAETSQMMANLQAATPAYAGSLSSGPASSGGPAIQAASPEYAASIQRSVIQRNEDGLEEEDLSMQLHPLQRNVEGLEGLEGMEEELG